MNDGRRRVRPTTRRRTDDDRRRTTARRGPTTGTTLTTSAARAKEKKKRGFSGCLAVLVALAVVVGGAFFAGTKGFHYLKDHLSHAADYSGPGHGQGAVRGQGGRLDDRDRPQPQGRRVVASVDAFIERRATATKRASRSASTS